jgi:hypothetical protein
VGLAAIVAPLEVLPQPWVVLARIVAGQFVIHIDIQHSQAFLTGEIPDLGDGFGQPAESLGPEPTLSLVEGLPKGTGVGEAPTQLLQNRDLF